MLEEFKSLSKENNKLEEKPDANNTPESLEEAQSNALMALADTAASLSRAVNKIAAYVPTQWVDNSEPSINANKLMHIENGIRDATAAVNSAIDAITEINGNIQGIDSRLIRGSGYTSLEVSNDDGTLYRMQFSANGGLIHLYENSGSGWYRTDSLALKSDLSITQEGIPGMSEQIVLLYNHYFVAICIKLSAYSAENSGWKVITTLPNKFRPKTTIDAVLIDNNVNSFNSPKAIAARVLKDGGLLVYNYHDHLTNVAPIGIIFYPL